MRSEVTSGKQGGICFDEFSRVQGLKLCFHPRSLIYAADKEGVWLWEGEDHTQPSNSLEMYLHKNTNLQ